MSDDLKAQQLNEDGTWGPLEPLKPTWETDPWWLKFLARHVWFLRWRAEDAIGKEEGLG